MAAGWGLRVLRAAVFTAVCVVLSAAGHTLAGGGHVPPATLAVGFAAVLVASTALAGRERSLPGIAALSAVGQLGLHTLFALGVGHSPQPAPEGGARDLAQRLLCNEQAVAGMSQAEAQRVVEQAGLQAAPAAQSAHAAHTAPLAGVETPLECLRSAARVALGAFDAPMLLGHLLVAVAIGWLLRRGEAALWRLTRLPEQAARFADEVFALRALRAALVYAGALRTGRLLPAVGRAPRAERAEPPPHSVLLAHSVHTRGPPEGCLILAA
ncbi:hypothetical protein [Streptomyces sulphureus]|uniref:hypothetical protein n=1 Tax=Streptomyces sulphureus TaxID=47758 RepID=UPI00047615D9|nr:hypothetical protein [Streptomyces sulphureus]